MRVHTQFCYWVAFLVREQSPGSRTYCVNLSKTGNQRSPAERERDKQTDTQAHTQAYNMHITCVKHIIGLRVCVLSRVRLCHPVDCSSPGSSVHRISEARNWSKLPFAPPGDLPDPGIKPMSPASPAPQADSLPLSHLEITSGQTPSFTFPSWVNPLPRH